MTFLELVKRTKQECGISGADPSTVIGQSRETKRLVDWVVQSFVELQEEHWDWDFLRKSVTFNTVAGTQVYPVGPGSAAIDLADFAVWRNDSFRAYLQSAGVATEVILSQYKTFSDFRDFYLLGSRRLVTGRPLYISIAPDRSLYLGFTPNDVYVVSGEHYRTPQVLALDADIPIIPERYHMAIVYRAMIKYGMFEVANEQIAAGKEGYTKILRRMEADQLPQVTFGDSLI